MNAQESSQPLDPALTDSRVRKVELTISSLLRAGVIASLVLVVVGIVVMFLQQPGGLTTSDQLALLTSPHASFPHSIADVLRDLGAGRGQAIIALGLLTLIATPVLRVAVSIVAFIVQRDRIFTVITTAVLVLLLLSFVLGAVE